jgi:predicted ATP-grasp superfamily ATP-dependent carboligase
MENFIVVGSSVDLTVPVLLGLSVYTNAHCCVVGPEQTRPLRWSSLCASHVHVDLRGKEDDKFIYAIGNIAKSMPGAILIPVDVDAERIVNRVRDQLSVKIIPIPDLPTIETLNNKWLFYEFCKEHGFNVPETRMIGSKHDFQFDQVASELGEPLVIKPLDERGSDGVRIVHSSSHYDQLVRNNPKYNYAPLIVQRFIPGGDLGLDVFSMQGNLSAYAIQQKIGSEVSFLSNQYLEQMATEFCRASCYTGVMNIDARLENSTGKVYLLEANPRFWGSLAASVWCGLNFVAESIEQVPGTSHVRSLKSGQFEPYRHPIIRPKWWTLAFNRGVQGRMLRSMMFDPYLGLSFISSLPKRLRSKYVSRKAALAPAT